MDDDTNNYEIANNNDYQTPTGNTLADSNSTPTPIAQFGGDDTLTLGCISKDTTVEIVDNGAGGYYYAFGSNGYQTPFKLNIGIYKLNVPSEHPLYLTNHDTSKITITGNNQSAAGYHGNVEIIVYSDFGTISYACTVHGSMGGNNNLVFDDNCELGYDLPTPTPNLQFAESLDSTPTPNVLGTGEVDMVFPDDPTPTPFLSTPTSTFDGALSCLLYTSPSPRDLSTSRMPSSA